MEQRESFVFYRSFFEALQGCPDDIRLAVYEEMMQYALYSDYTPKLEGVGKALFTLIRPQIDANLRKRENGKKGAEYGQRGGRPTTKRPQENPKETPKQPQENPKETPNVNVNDNVNDNVNVNVKELEATTLPTRTRERFIKPTIKEVTAYVIEKGYTFNPQAFYDYYEANGWRVGKNPMKKWKAACANWQRMEQTIKPNNNGTGFTNAHPSDEQVVRQTYELVEELGNRPTLDGDTMPF